MNKKRPSWEIVLAYLLAAFFLFGAVGNILAFGQIAADYSRWGYPAHFHYLTGALELVTAALLFRGATRRWGMVLGAVVMIAATATVLLNGEYSHSVPPLVVLVVIGVLAWVSNRKRAEA